MDVAKVAVQEAVRTFADARLLTLDRDPLGEAPTVEVAHEALLTEWDRLRDWIAAARDDVRRHVALRAAIAEWHAAGRDRDYLLTGSRLADYVSWATTASIRPTIDERAFVDASVAADADRASAEAQRVADEERLVRSARHRLWALVALLGTTVAAGAAILATVFAPGPPRVGLLTPGFDSSVLGRQVASGFDRAARELEIEPEVLDPISDADVEVREYLDTGPDLVVVDTRIDTELGIDVATLVDDHPDVQFALIGSSGSFDPASVTAPNAAAFPFAHQTGAFLAGAAAALESRTGTVGFVGALPDVIDDFRAGFEEGARHVDPGVTVLSAYTVRGLQPFWWPGPANEAATRLYDQGADVVFHAAGDAGGGVHRAAMDASARLGRHLWSIGVDADEWLLVPPTQRPHVLTSLLKRNDTAIGLAVAAHLDGTLNDLVLTAGNGGLSLSDSGEHLASTTTERVAELTASMAAGELAVGTDVAEPPTSSGSADVRIDLRVAERRCIGDVDPDMAVDVGDAITVSLANPSPAAVAIEARELVDERSFAEVAGTTDLDPLVGAGWPWAAATAVPDGAHRVTFSPTSSGVWVISCHHHDGGVDQPVAVVAAERVIGPVTGEATVTATSDACTWDGPATFAVDDVVRIALANDAGDSTGFGAGRFVSGSDAFDIAVAADALITGIGWTLEDVAPGEVDQMLLHVQQPGTWSIACFLPGTENPLAAVVFDVE